MARPCAGSFGILHPRCHQSVPVESFKSGVMARAWFDGEQASHIDLVVGLPFASNDISQIFCVAQSAAVLKQTEYGLGKPIKTLGERDVQAAFKVRNPYSTIQPPCPMLTWTRASTLP